ncbi:MAG: carbohydrate-binding family 9-like protein [Acidobacteria bacterium]|nr:carbohydrate-binding family 9-like protein [Acidobacteriota bacterium]
MRHILIACAILLLTFGGATSQDKMPPSNRLTISHIADDFAIDRLADPAWEGTSQVLVSKYWSGKAAAKGREFSARLLWSDTALYVRFEASQSEPLVVSEKPDTSQKTIGLWDRDVCEIFIAPDTSQRKKYFEFEIAPTGEWIDLAIDATSQKRKTDLGYNSGMTSAARIEKDKVVMAIKIPWEAFGVARPKIGDVWLGNLFRCVGKGKTRGYLAWQPTKTAKPNFHVPEKFGEFEFVK